jgi:ubiquinone/menaquinone biosynthesis C-methylase UbiE
LAGARVLDVGCGSGYFLQRLHEYGAADCHGIDLMEDRIARGRELYPTLELQVGSATELPFPDGRFDLVAQFTCLSSILDDGVRLEAAREMRRVAAGGWILSWDMRRVRRRGPTPTVELHEQELRRLFGEPALLRRAALRFELTQLVRGHSVLTAALAALPPLRSHFLGLWRVSA